MGHRDVGSIPGSGRSPGGGHGNPLHYSYLENPHGQRSLVHRGLRSIGSHRVGHSRSDGMRHASVHTLDSNSVTLEITTSVPAPLGWEALKCSPDLPAEAELETGQGATSDPQYPTASSSRHLWDEVRWACRAERDHGICHLLSFNLGDCGCLPKCFWPWCCGTFFCYPQNSSLSSGAIQNSKLLVQHRGLTVVF